MRFAAVVAALFLSLTPVLAAQSYDSPQAMLQAFYAPYLNDEFPDNSEQFRSAALQGLIDHDIEITPDGDMGALDFDPFINGQDYEITDLQIGEPEIDGDRAVVVVTFKNFDEPNSLTYDLVNEDGWKIDDVASSTGEYPYRLSEIFAQAAEQ
jgi:hypothetical protein